MSIPSNMLLLSDCVYLVQHFVYSAGYGWQQLFLIFWIWKALWPIFFIFKYKIKKSNSVMKEYEVEICSFTQDCIPFHFLLFHSFLWDLLLYATKYRSSRKLYIHIHSVTFRVNILETSWRSILSQYLSTLWSRKCIV